MDIELIESASNEIAEYSKTEVALADLRARMANVEYDVTTTKGMAVAKADRAEVRKLRTGLEAMRKSIKAPALAHCKLIDDEAKRITAELLKLETPIDEQIKARELVLESERDAREAAEKARIAAITERIAGIRQYVELAALCRTAERIQSLQDKLAEIVIEGFDEFQEEAKIAWKQAGEKVEALLTLKLEQEAEQARIKAEQAAAAEKLAAEKAAFEAQQAAAKAEADRAEAQRAAAQALLDAQQAELARQRAEFDAQVRHQAELAAEQARTGIEAARQAESVPAVLLDAISDVVELCAQAEPEPEAPACCAPDGLCTDACSNSPEATVPSDADVISVVISEVTFRFNWSEEQALERLAAIRDWKI